MPTTKSPVPVATDHQQNAVSTLFDALRTGDEDATEELPNIPQGTSGRGSTVHVDFYSTKPIYSVEKCHLNAMVADTGKWEQSAAFALDVAPAMARWVKNDHLGLAIPYRKRNIQARYYPDFIAVLESGLQLIIVVKGQYDDDADRKAKAAERWVAAVNRSGEHGAWRYMVVEDPQKLDEAISEISTNSSVGQLEQSAG